MSTRSVSEPVLRVIGYARISKETESSTSIERQRARIEAKAAERGWHLVGIEQDNDVSATHTPLKKRVGLSRVRERISAGEADAVVVWRLDRIARSVSETSVLLDEGLRIVATDQDFDCTTSMGRALVQIAQVFAELEAATIAERVRNTRSHLAAQHKHGGGVVAYGYKSVPHPSGRGRALEVEPTEAAHVRAAADHVLDGGSLYGAVQLLRERGSTPRRAAQWSLSSLRVVLTGDAVLGRVTHRRAVVRDDDGLPVTPWPAVLPLADVERLRALLAPQRGRGAHSRKRAARLLSGLVHCSACGGRMRVSTSTQTSTGKRVSRYACQGRSDGRGCETPASVTADLLDHHVEREFLLRVGALPVVEVVEVRREAAGLADVEAAIRDLGAAITQPGADVAALARTIAELHARREELQAAPVEPVVERRETGETFAEAWSARDVGGRRGLLVAALDGGIEVGPGRRGRKGLDASRLSVPWRWERGSGDDPENHGRGDSSGPH